MGGKGKPRRNSYRGEGEGPWEKTTFLRGGGRGLSSSNETTKKTWGVCPEGDKPSPLLQEEKEGENDLIFHMGQGGKGNHPFPPPTKKKRKKDP